MMVSQRLINKLNEREIEGCPIKVAVAGTGFIGRGLINQISLMKGIKVVAVANRSVDKAEEVIKQSKIGELSKVCKDEYELNKTIREGKIAIVSNPLLLAESEAEIVVDTTGDVMVGASLALAALNNKKHFIANPETDVTVGPVLSKIAEENGVTFSDQEGDEPGVIMGLHRFARLLGLDIVAAGKFKKFYDKHANPTTVRKWADKLEQNPYKISCFTDGSKMSIEMALVSNATGLVPDIRGMHLPSASLETVTKVLDTKENGGVLSSKGVIDIVFGVEPSGGVYVIATTSHPRIRKDLQYYKMGDGPNYLFYRPYHLCSFEMAVGIARAVIEGDSTIKPLGKPIADVLTVAKKDLFPGDTLDSIGGYSYYGLIDKAETIKEEKLLPIGLAKGVRVIKPIKIDSPITFEDIEIDDTTILWKLRQQYNNML